MRFLCARRWLALLALVAGLVLLTTANAADDKKDDEGFTPLFNGKDFTGWKMVLEGGKGDPEKTWSVKEGVIVCTGKPSGYFHSDKSYKNYVLRYDWRYKRPDSLKEDKDFGGNSGLLVHIQGDHKIWPKCVEVQGMNRDHGRILPLGVKFKNNVDKAAQKEAIKPVGEWNTTEVTCKGGDITVKINGKQVDSGTGELTDGPFGFQSEGAEIHFRNIKIKEMK